MKVTVIVMICGSLCIIERGREGKGGERERERVEREGERRRVFVCMGK